MADRGLRLSLLGRLHVERAGQRLDVRGRKVEALLAYLALPPGRRHSRDHLAGLLWGGMGEAHARHNLRQAVAVLRRVLGDQVIAADGNALYLDPAAVSVDVMRLEEPGRVEADVPCGELLEGLSVREDPFDEWLADQRAQLKAVVCDRLGFVAGSRADAGDLDGAMAAARRLLALDPANEQAHRLLMTLYARSGARAAALRQYEQCVVALERHLSVQPGAETTRLLQAIRDSAAEAADRPALVVLPFTSSGAAADDDFFGIGMAEDLTSALSQFGSLLVISASTSYTFRGLKPDVGRLGRDLGVQYVVTGTVRRSGARVRVSVHLVDALTASELWARTYDHALADVFAIQDDITATLVATLASRVEAAALERARRRPTESLAAYDCYLRGKDHHHRWTRDDNTRALEMFERAVALDPGFALAHAWMACGLYQRTFFDQDPTLVTRCFEAVQRAYVLGGAESEVHRMLAAFHLLWRDFEKAEFHIDRAFALNPNDDRIVCQIGELAMYSGRPADGERWVRRALGLNPLQQLPRYWLRLAQTLYHQSRLDESLAMLGRETIPVPHQPTYRIAVLARLGRKDDAARVIEALDVRGVPTVEELVRPLPYRRPADRDEVARALRLAGLS